MACLTFGRVGSRVNNLINPLLVQELKNEKKSYTEKWFIKCENVFVGYSKKKFFNLRIFSFSASERFFLENLLFF